MSGKEFPLVPGIKKNKWSNSLSYPEIRRVLEPFRRREDRHRANRKKLAPEVKNLTPLHIFDKRRAHYLKYESH
jgi:hypothetical protein